MSNLAQTYSALGRHADALAMGERVLEFRRRVLPANHPEIGEGCVGGMGCMRCGDFEGIGLICLDVQERP